MRASGGRPKVSDPSPAGADVLIEEARRRHRKRRRWGAAGAFLLAGAGIAIGLSVSASGAGHHAVSAAVRIAPPLPAALSGRGATTAFVSDAAGLVPISLTTGARGPVIPISGFGGTASVVSSPNGRMAYVVTLPTPARPGVDEAGPAIVPVNLVTRQRGKPIPFRASAYSSGTGANRSVSFGIAGVGITPNGTTVLVADAADHSVIPIDVATRTVERPIVLPVVRTVGSLIAGNPPISNYAPVQPADFGAIAVDPNGQTAYLTDGYIVVPVSLTRHRALTPIAGLDAPSGIAIDPSGQFAYVTSPYCWQSFKTGACGPIPTRPVSEPNGRIQLYAGGNHVSVIDLRTDRVVTRINVGLGAMPTGVAVSPSGLAVYVTYGQYGGHGNDLAVIDARTNTIERQLRIALPANLDEGAAYLSITPTGKEAFVTGFSVLNPGPGPGGTVFRGAVLVDLSTGRPASAVSFGKPVSYGQSTGSVIFGR